MRLPLNDGDVEGDEIEGEFRITAEEELGEPLMMGEVIACWAETGLDPAEVFVDGNIDEGDAVWLGKFGKEK